MPKSGALLTTLIGHRRWLTHAVWNEAGSRILTASGDGTARVWDVESGDELTVLAGHTGGGVMHAVWNRDGNRIMTSGEDGTTRVWDAESGKELVTLSGHIQAVFRAIWNADESRILTTSGDDTARIWDAESGVELAVLTGHREALLQADWNADESRIVTASGDGTARQHYARMEDLLDAACWQAPRNMTLQEWRRFIGDEPYQRTCPNLPSGAE